MIIKARFTGQDGSMGYRVRSNYQLVLKIKPDVCGKDIIEIQCITGNGRLTKYESLRSFLDNWAIL